MELAWLESFVALCEHESFTRAAQSQHLSQPAFSRRINGLERWAGARLFDRSTYPVSLTAAGTALRGDATFLLNALSDTRSRLHADLGELERPLRIATSHSLAVHFFPTWWQKVLSTVGPVNIQVLPMDTFDAYDSVINGECDLLVAHVDPDQRPLTGDGQLESTTLAADSFGPYSAVVDGRPKFALPIASGETVLTVSHGAAAYLGRLNDRILAATRGRYITVAQTDLTAAAARLVAAGVGAGWLLATVAEDLVREGMLVPLPVPGTTKRLDIRLHRRAGYVDDSRVDAVWTFAQTDMNVDL